MNRKKIKADQARKKEPRGIPLTDAGLNAFEETVKETAKKNPKFNERLPHILRYLTMLREHILENDVRRAIFTSFFLDYELYGSGFEKPLYAKLAAIKGGQAPKEKKGIIIAIRELLPEMKITTPSYMWRYLMARYDSENNAYTTADLAYDVWLDRDIIDDRPNSGVLRQKKDLGQKKLHIKFKAFESLFYRVRAEKRPPQA